MAHTADIETLFKALHLQDKRVDELTKRVEQLEAKYAKLLATLNTSVLPVVNPESHPEWPFK